MHHVLVDEVQDFSTMELDIVRRLVADPGGQNRFFFVGDLNQKVFPKQHHTVRAGFDFTGRARTLTRNYRNTKQILRAAYCIPEHFPPQADEQLEVAAAELSQYEGGQPVCLGCTRKSHVRRVLEVVRRRRGRRLAVVSENDTLLAEVRREAV
jgi:superfamily I DNA/RNA helicase